MSNGMKEHFLNEFSGEKRKYVDMYDFTPDDKIISASFDFFQDHNEAVENYVSDWATAHSENLECDFNRLRIGSDSEDDGFF